MLDTFYYFLLNDFALDVEQISDQGVMMYNNGDKYVGEFKKHRWKKYKIEYSAARHNLINRCANYFQRQKKWARMFDNN